MTTALARAIDLTQTITTTTRHRSFVKAVRAFVALLDTVPDASPSEWSHDTLMLLRNFSDDVIAAIEKQLRAGTESERELTVEVYAIRRAVEEMVRWERHYLGTA